MSEKTAKKSILPIVIGIFAIIVIVGVAWFIISRNNGGDKSAENNNSSTVVDDTKVTANELEASKVTENVDYGDYTAMFTLSKAIQNGQKIGAIVSIDGVVSHKVSSYSIGQNNPDKSKDKMDYVGTVFVIQDGDSADYPKDGERVTIVAKVMEVSPLNFQLVTLKNFVKS